MKRKNLIPRLYRITAEQDKIVKQKAKKYGGESAFIRAIIDGDAVNQYGLGSARADR